ncbi:MAG: hypothetical protein K2N18_03755, partial [Clostridia bacterium]|nr:hypothetical protein [Clostridia bacterium]
YNLHPTTVRGILHIKKAPSVIISPTRYDILEGQSIIMVATVENVEQTVVIPAFTDTAVGVYHLTLTTAESTNYLAGSLDVTVSINRTEKYVGNISYPAMYDGTYLYGILVNTETGIPNDAEISFIPFKCDNYYLGVNISVTVDGGAYDKAFTVKLRMTDEMLSAKSLKLFAEDGTEIAYTVENGVYMVFETDGSAVFYMQAEFAKKFAWYWIPIGIAIALIAIGAVLVILWKKGIIKIPLKLPRKTSAKTASVENAPAQQADAKTADIQATQDTAAKPESEATATETIKEQDNE